MTNSFESPFKGKLLTDQVTNPNIRVGRHSYHSGYYHGHSFDECARYLLPDRNDVDQLIIGSFCSIGSGASFIMAGNQGHRYDWRGHVFAVFIRHCWPIPLLAEFDRLTT